MNLTHSKFADSSLIIELKGRAKIGLFMVLSWQLALFISPKIASAAVIMILASLFEIASMVIVFRFSQGKNIANDINEFSCYALLAHLIQIPVFYLTSISSDYHNNFIWVLFILSIARLMYIGKKTEAGDYKGLPTFGLLGFLKNKLAKTNKTSFKYCSELLFFGSALPLWFIVYRTNDQSISVTVVGLMLFIYLITDVIKIKTATAQNDTVRGSGANTELLCNLFNAKSKGEQAIILKMLDTNINLEAAAKFLSGSIANETDVETSEHVCVWTVPQPTTPAETARNAIIDALVSENFPTAAEIQAERDLLTFDQAEDLARAEQANRLQREAEKRSQRNLVANIDAASKNRFIASLYDDQEKRSQLLNYETIILCAIFNSRSPEAQRIIFNIIANDFNVGEQDDFLQSVKAVAEARDFINLMKTTNDLSLLSDKAIAVAAGYQGAKPDVKRSIDLALQWAEFNDRLSGSLLKDRIRPDDSK